jgi:hypothetical protein
MLTTLQHPPSLLSPRRTLGVTTSLCPILWGAYVQACRKSDVHVRCISPAVAAGAAGASTSPGSRVYRPLASVDTAPLWDRQAAASDAVGQRASKTWPAGEQLTGSSCSHCAALTKAEPFTAATSAAPTLTPAPLV